MAAGQPPNNKETVYNTRVLSKWFAIASILLLVVTIWAAIQDFARPWKVYQRQSQKISTAVAERKLMEADKAMNKQQLENIEKDISEVEKKQAEVTKEIDSKISAINAKLYGATKRYQIEKGKLDAAHYHLEEAIKERADDLNEIIAKYKEDETKVAKLAHIEERIHLAFDKANADKKDILSKETDLSARLTSLTRTRDQLNKIVEKNGVNLVNLARNAPLLDFISPTVKVNQVILNGLYDDYFFNKVPRVDRCMTCHVNANQPGFEDFPQPFATHSKLHLIAGPDSPHPAEKIGCTVCHAGVPQSVDFNNSAHTPADPVQAAEWTAKYHFHYSEHIKTHMIPLKMVEGQCIQCHAKEVVFKDAPTLNSGMRLIERYGCYGCHKFSGHFEKLATEKKPAPSLERVASKVSPDWIKKWLWNPKSFRPSTLMPAFWQVHNNSDEASIARGKVEVDAIAHLIVAKSKVYEPLQLASKVVGDSSRGKALVSQVGCVGCHAINDIEVKRPTDPTALGYRDPRVPMFGPELNQLGSKVTYEWLASWLKLPQHYWAQSSMPSMKLSDQEVADIAVYLLEKKNPEFEALQVPVPDDTVRDDVVLEFLLGSMPTRDARLKLASMSLEEKQTYLGDKLISHYGCYGCHAIQGYENAPNIGAELTAEGSKEVTKFAFDNVEIPHTSRAAWIFTKIRTPRIWDVGKKRDFQAKTRMPHFGFTAEQANALATVVTGYENKNVSSEMIAPVDGRKEAIIAGHRLINQKNCVGCHAMEDKTVPWGGEVLAHYTDKSEGPPLLYTEGRKLQTDWLFKYLKNTNVMIRPWVKIRMPTFGLSDTQTTTLVKYFSAYDSAESLFSSKRSTLSSEQIHQAEGLIKTLGCLTCHAVVAPGGDASAHAPHFANIKARLSYDWVPGWLENPNAIMPGTRMPQLWPNTDPLDEKSPRIGVEGVLGGDASKQIELIRDYLFQYPGEPELPPPAVQPAPPAVSASAATSGSGR
ncbi:MAG: c-type cytochrome [Bdellovibrionota bacterium]